MVLDREFPPDTRVENEIETLIQTGHKVHLACFTKTKRIKFEKINGAFIHRRSISNFTYKSSIGCLRFPFYFNFWRNYLSELFQQFSFDAIHIHDLPLGIVGYELKRKYNVPLIIDLHENWPALLEKAVHTNTILGKLLSSNKQWIKYEKEILEKADMVIAVVLEMKQRLIGLGIDEKNIIIVSNTLKMDSFKVPDFHSDPEFFTLFYAGGINAHRGLQVVIKGLKIITPKIRNIRFWIVGSGSYQKELEKLVSSLNLKKHVRFWGWKNLNEIAELLMKSDIALIPHLKSEHTDNTIPHKLFQYMYAGKPIIASNCEPIRRIMNESKCGIVYENQLTDCLLKFYKNPEIGKCMGENGKKIVIEKYNWKKTEKILLELYQK